MLDDQRWWLKNKHSCDVSVSSAQQQKTLLCFLTQLFLWAVILTPTPQPPLHPPPTPTHILFHTSHITGQTPAGPTALTCSGGWVPKQCKGIVTGADTDSWVWTYNGIASPWSSWMGLNRRPRHSPGLRTHCKDSTQDPRFSWVCASEFVQ